MGDRRCACSVLVRRLDGKRPLGRPGCRWEDNIKIYLQEVAWGDMDWSDMAQDRDKWWEIMNAVMNIRLT
jgi:hypothetical protein